MSWCTCIVVNNAIFHLLYAMGIKNYTIQYDHSQKDIVKFSSVLYKYNLHWQESFHIISKHIWPLSANLIRTPYLFNESNEIEAICMLLKSYLFQYFWKNICSLTNENPSQTIQNIEFISCIKSFFKCFRKGEAKWKRANDSMYYRRYSVLGPSFWN